MVRYRRNFVPGGSYFFTVTLADRTSSALVDNATALRMAFRIARHERPFTIDAIVILPDHLHAIWTLPSGDCDFSGRWRSLRSIRATEKDHRSRKCECIPIPVPKTSLIVLASCPMRGRFLEAIL